MSMSSPIPELLLAYSRSILVLELSTTVLVVSLIILSFCRGYLPSWAKWCALVGLLGVFRLWSRRHETLLWYLTQGPYVIDNLGATLAVAPAVLHPDYPLLLDPSGLEKKTAIELIVADAAAADGFQGWIANVNNGFSIYNKISHIIWGKSNFKSCTAIHATLHDGKIFQGYAYEATTTGSNCDTTATLEIIDNAVQKCATQLHNSKDVSGCCLMVDGFGTWHGHLRLTADPMNYPAKEVKCHSS